MENNEVVLENTLEDGKKRIIYVDGTSYLGFTNNDGKPDGKGAIYDKNGNIEYLGQFKNGMRDGQGTKFYNEKDDDRRFYCGQFKENMREGNGTVHHKDGKTVKGNFIKDKIEGKATVFLKDKNRRLEGEFKDGKINGHTRIYRENRLVYEGEFKDGKANGLGIYHFPDNNSKYCYIGDFNQGVREGSGKMLYRSGSVYKGEFKNGKPNGLGIHRFRDNDSRDYYIGNFDQGVRKGSGKIFYKSGSAYEGDFKNNLPDGKGKYFCKDGGVYEGYFKNNLPDQNYGPDQNDNFGLPDAYKGDLNGNHLDEFPTLENYIKEQFEKCQEIFKKVANQIGINDTHKQAILDKYYEEIVEKKRANDYEALIKLQQKMLNLPYSS